MSTASVRFLTDNAAHKEPNHNENEILLTGHGLKNFNSESYNHNLVRTFKLKTIKH